VCLPECCVTAPGSTGAVVDNALTLKKKNLWFSSPKKEKKPTVQLHVNTIAIFTPGTEPFCYNYSLTPLSAVFLLLQSAKRRNPLTLPAVIEN
jgi:hypothetical protein